MTLSLNSKEGRSILTSLADISEEGASFSAKAGRNLVGSLGFRLVGLVRQIFQSPDGYQDWLNDQRNRVAKEFIAICKNEVKLSEQTEVKLARDGRVFAKESGLSPSSIEMLRTQTGRPERLRVLTPNEFERLLIPQNRLNKRNMRSGLQRFIDLINPFDQTTLISENDWLDQFRSSGQALKIEMTEMLESYYDLLQSNWNPADVNVWVSIGAHLIRLNDDLARLCQSAEELLLAGMAKEAGFNLTLIFTLLKGLVSERAILSYVIAHPHLIQNVQNWDEAIAKVRAD
jgi:hypothetical protein